MKRKRDHTLIIVKISLTVLKAALAGMIPETFSAMSKAAIATVNEEMTFSWRFCCLVVESMGEKSES